MKTKIPLFSLVLLIVSAIDSIRTLPTTAFFGGQLVVFFLIAAVLFLFPISFISAEFSSRYPEEGGVFHWVRCAFGPRAGVLAVWLQWINTMVWYPTMLLFIAGTAAHLIDPALAQNKFFLIGVAYCIFWGLTAVNLKGIQVSAKINTYCATLGTLLPMVFLIALGIGWVAYENPLAIDCSWNALIPSLNFSESRGALITIMASFLGMELAGVYVGDIANPQKNFPKAIGYSVMILLTTLILGALSIAIVIPRGDIQFIDGVMQTFSLFLQHFNMSFLVPVFALLIVLGSTGGSINWLLSPAKGLLQTAQYGFIPPFFAKENRHGVAVRILGLQAVLVSLFCLSIQLMPSINTFYWFFMALSTGLYMLMYILLFLAALKLKRPERKPGTYQIPRGIRTVSCLLGLVGCVLTIVIGFEPASGAPIESRLYYAGMIALGLISMLVPVPFLWLYQKRRNNNLQKSSFFTVIVR